MLFMIRRIWRDFPGWERPAQISFLLALLLLVTAFVMVLIAPQEERVRFLIAFGALMLVSQGIVLWANRGMVAPITQAQRAYMRGAFDEVLKVLEPLRQSGNADITHLTLLGNTYRQLGDLQASESVLSEAVDKVPNHHYSLYGFGRTLIVQGRYEIGADYVARALAAGAPPIVRFDLGEALYRLGRWDDAQKYLSDIPPDEVHRVLMAHYWHYAMGMAESPSEALIVAGLPYWVAQVERFSATPYGEAVAQDVAQLRALIDGKD